MRSVLISGGTRGVVAALAAKRAVPSCGKAVVL